MSLGNDYDVVIGELVWWVMVMMVMIRSCMAMMIDGDDEGGGEGRLRSWMVEVTEGGLHS